MMSARDPFLHLTQSTYYFVLNAGNELWRFNRIHDYGPMYEDPSGMSLALGGSYLDVNNQDDDSVGDELVDGTLPK